MKNEIDFINEIANRDDCNGNCDLLYPYIKCSECYARNALNEIGELIRYKFKVLKEILREKEK